MPRRTRIRRPSIALALACALPFACGLIEHQPAEATGADAEAGDDDAGKPDKLATLGYLGATQVDAKDTKKSGVTLHKDEAQVGRVLWTSNGWGPGFFDVPGQVARREAVLMDPDGTEVHRWKGPQELAGPPGKPNGWANVVLGADGSLFVVDFMTRVLKVGWDSEVLWQHPGRYHHDIDLDADGNVWTLTSEETEVEFQGGKRWIWDDLLELYDAETGEKLRSLPVYANLSKIDGFDAVFADVLERRTKKSRARSDLDAVTKKASVDAFHTNTVHVLRRPLEGVWEAGDLLTCFRNISLIAVVDKDDGAIKWSWRDAPVDHPHDPSFLENDHILLFDNRPKKGKSRIVEMDPRTKEITWTYESSGEKFYSSIRGQVSRLSGGHTMIVDSQRGRLFEVTRDGDVVWEFFSPDTFMRDGDAKQGKKGKRGKKGKAKRKNGKAKKVMMRVPIRAKLVEPEASAAVDRILAGGAGAGPARAADGAVEAADADPAG